MIIGLEWIVLVLFVLFVITIAIALIFHERETIAVGLSVFATICIVGVAAFFIGVSNAQSNVEEHYIDYLKLQVQVVQYDDLDMLEQYKVSTDVMTYNLWYERNKSDLENEWTWKGTSDYAKEFGYIVIGG